MQIAGMVECKPSEDARVVLDAFSQFAAERQVRAPFKVVGVKGHDASAWPLQYHPEAIALCDGFVNI